MKILTICIPTYNRCDLIVDDVNKYLSVPDKRFSVKVCDNDSTDNTINKLSSIKDDRLILVKNEKNIGAIPNMIKSLSNNDSLFSLLVLDKDILDVSYIEELLNQLQSYKECGFGFINPERRLSGLKARVEWYNKKGVQNVLKTSYLNQHPSGYLYSSKVINEVIRTDRIKSINPTFVFIFEVINSELALNYDSIIFDWPMVIRARERGDDSKSITYSESNLWYSCDYRLNTYTVYLNDIINLKTNIKSRKKIAYLITKKELKNITSVLKSLMINDYACEHYVVSKRKVGYMEMITNAQKLLNIYKTQCVGVFPKFYICLKYYQLRVFVFINILLSYVK